MFLSSEILFPSITLERDFPKNIKTEDVPLFEPSKVGQSWEIKWKRYADLTANNEVFLKENFFILMESFGDEWQSKKYNTLSYATKSFVKDKLRRNVSVNEVVWCLDTFSTGGYFHWITEIIPRLWIAEQHLDRDIPFPLPSYFLTKWKFGNDLLKPFGRKTIVFEESDLLRIKTANIITQPGGPLNYQPIPLTKAVQKVKEFYYDSAYPTTIPKIYISRQKTGRRVVLNEPEVTNLLARYGYTTLHLEDLSIYDQVNLFSRAKEVVSIHGAGLTNMAFMERGKVVEIRQRKVSSMLNFFFTLSHIFQHDYYYSFDALDGEQLAESRKNPRFESASIHADTKMLKEVLDSFIE